MESFLNRYRNLSVLLLVIGAQLLLLAYQVKNNQDVRLVRVWAVTAVTPLANVLEVVRRNTIGVVEDYFVLIRVREENKRMQQEMGRLKLENQFLKTELQTADRAQALRAFQSRTPSRTIAARIIGNGTGTNSKDVLIDRGTTSGLMRGMAVVTPDGIVGKVLAAYPTASQVLLITDPTFAAGVISEKNRAHGTLKGLGQNKCLVDFVQNEEKVDVGEMFYTSGEDRIFPKGLPVGVATVVRAGRNFKEIYVVPASMQNGLEEVLVVLEGIHQEIPNSQTASSGDVYILPPPPGQQAAGQQAAPRSESPLNTDADRMLKKYEKIGAAEGITYGVRGVKAPNFNIQLDQVPPPRPPQQPGAATKTNPSVIVPQIARPAPRPVQPATTDPPPPQNQ